MTTERLYLEDAYLREFAAQVTESAEGWSALSRSAFHPGGGGQPFDQGSLTWSVRVLAVTGVREDAERRLWHQIGVDVPVGEAIHGTLDWPRRFALMRYAQACGGTHVHSTMEIGEARVAKFDNRGKNNKRFYWELGS